MSEPTGSACARTGPTTEKIIRIFAGTVILLSLAVGVAGSPLFLSPNWLWLTGFVGANLLQSAFTGLCPLDTLLRKVFHVRTEAEAARMSH